MHFNSASVRNEAVNSFLFPLRFKVILTHFLLLGTEMLTFHVATNIMLLLEKGELRRYKRNFYVCHGP